MEGNKTTNNPEVMIRKLAAKVLLMNSSSFFSAPDYMPLHMLTPSPEVNTHFNNIFLYSLRFHLPKS